MMRMNERVEVNESKKKHGCVCAKEKHEQPETGGQLESDDWMTTTTTKKKKKKKKTKKLRKMTKSFETL